MTTYTLAEIAQALGAEALGDETLVLRGLSEPQDAAHDQLALAFSESAAADLSAAAEAALLWSDADWKALGLKGAICVPRPRFSLGPLSNMFDEGPKIGSGVHPSAVIDPSAVIGKGTSVVDMIFTILVYVGYAGSSFLMTSASTLGNRVAPTENI